MNPTRQTLLEQMRFTDFEISARQQLLEIGDQDIRALKACRENIGARVDDIVTAFYEQQTNVPEVAALIGDAETMQRLVSAQRRYVLDLFGGVYDREYVNNRLRIGLVHKRIGVEPKLYLAAVYLLRRLIAATLREEIEDKSAVEDALIAMDKLIFFDVTLVFETYIQSMLSEIDAARRKSEEYARALEEMVQARTGQLRTDPVTGLTTRRYLDAALARALSAAHRRAEPVTVVFVDIDRFKAFNDEQGHAKGDEVLRTVGEVLLQCARAEDICVRYGGDEFCVVLLNCTEQQADERFRRRVTELMRERLPEVTLSMGMAQTGPREFEEAEQLLARADRLMYRDKQTQRAAPGKGRGAARLRSVDGAT